MGARVRVVEDDASIAAGIVQGLRRFGFDVSLSTQGNDAVIQALAKPFDIIVLDLMLPEQSGFDVMAQLRSRVRGSGSGRFAPTRRGEDSRGGRGSGSRSRRKSAGGRGGSCRSSRRSRVGSG